LRTPLVIVTAVLAVLLLSSCTGTPDDDESSPTMPPSTSSASPTPSVLPTPSTSPDGPADETAAPATIIIGLNATDIVDASGAVLLSIDYGMDGDEAVAGVTALLGAPIATENVPQNPHYFETDITSWAGFEIGVRRPSAESTPTIPFYIEATAASSSGVAIAAIDGSQIGDSFDEALVGMPDFQIYDDQNYPPRALALEVDPAMSGDSIAFGLIVEESDDGGVIAVIKAPDYIYDAA
jgi:hypothetical protein